MQVIHTLFESMIKQKKIQPETPPTKEASFNS